LNSTSTGSFLSIISDFLVNSLVSNDDGDYFATGAGIFSVSPSAHWVLTAQDDSSCNVSLRESHNATGFVCGKFEFVGAEFSTGRVMTEELQSFQKNDPNLGGGSLHST
jgi:hypothetical protein